MDDKSNKTALRKLVIEVTLGNDNHPWPKLITAANKFKIYPKGRIDSNDGTLKRLNQLLVGKAFIANLNRQVLSAYYTSIVNTTLTVHMRKSSGNASNLL